MRNEIVEGWPRSSHPLRSDNDPNLYRNPTRKRVETRKSVYLADASAGGRVD